MIEDEVDKIIEVEKMRRKVKDFIKVNRRGNVDTAITTIFWCGVE